MNSTNFVDLTESDDDLEILPLPVSYTSSVGANRAPFSSHSTSAGWGGINGVASGPGSNVNNYLELMDEMADFDDDYKQNYTRIKQEQEDRKMQMELAESEKKIYAIQEERRKLEHRAASLVHQNNNNGNNGNLLNINANGERRQLPPSLQQNNNMPPPLPLPNTAYRPVATVSCSLVSLNQFTIKVDGGEIFAPEEVVRQVLYQAEGAEFDFKRQRFVFPIAAHASLTTALIYSSKLKVEPIPPKILSAAMIRQNTESLYKAGSKQEREALREKERATERTLSVEYEIPQQVLDALAPFQREAVHFACDPDTNNGRALIADEMGLGKTRSAIGCATAYKDEWPLLVVCPSSTRHHWQAELLNLLVPCLLQVSLEEGVIEGDITLY